MIYKIEPVIMADIFFIAKQDFLKQYECIDFTEEQYDDMVTEYFKSNYTREEMEDSFGDLEEAEPALQKACGYSEYAVTVTVPDNIIEKEKIKAYIQKKLPCLNDSFVFKKEEES